MTNSVAPEQMSHSVMSVLSLQFLLRGGRDGGWEMSVQIFKVQWNLYKRATFETDFK